MTVGGFFKARLSFPLEYPHMPPKMKFETPIFHPNSMPMPFLFRPQQTTNFCDNHRLN